MNEAETRAELIDPKLKLSGWGVVEGSKVQREYPITTGKIQAGGSRGKSLTADYVLVYHGRKLAVIEAKSNDLAVAEGVAQAKNYAEKLELSTTFCCNGSEIYQMCMITGAEGLIDAFPSPEELWHKTFAVSNPWEESFSRVTFEEVGGTKLVRYYQELAANQAFNAFSPFPAYALARIKPDEIRQKGCVPTNATVEALITKATGGGFWNTFRLRCRLGLPQRQNELIMLIRTTILGGVLPEYFSETPLSEACCVII